MNVFFWSSLSIAHESRTVPFLKWGLLSLVRTYIQNGMMMIILFTLRTRLRHDMDHNIQLIHSLRLKSQHHKNGALTSIFRRLWLALDCCSDHQERIYLQLIIKVIKCEKPESESYAGWHVDWSEWYQVQLHVKTLAQWSNNGWIKPEMKKKRNKRNIWKSM